MLENLGLLQRFAAAIGGDSLARRKPFPEPLPEVARRVGRDPAAPVMIGDSASDSEAAVNAGMCAVGVCWGYGNPRGVFGEREDRVVSRPGKIPDWLAGSVPALIQPFMMQ